MLKTFLISLPLFCMILVCTTHAHAEFSIERNLEEFWTNPKVYMDDHRHVQKIIQDDSYSLREPTTIHTRFTQESIETGSFREEKYSSAPYSQHYRPGRAAWTRDDNPANLVGELKAVTLEQMESQTLMSGEVADSPWSGHYWPLFSGAIAMRYSDPNFPKSRDWKLISRYINHLAPCCSLEHLSPAEKYDILIGDSLGTLTQKMLALGQEYYEKSGYVEPWIGICDGWAAASYMEKRPLHEIKVMAADGHTVITFYPDDIKALSTLLWSKAPFPSTQIGSRCMKRNPEKDNIGRLIDPECFDTNPGTWHLTVVNQIGIKKKSFILDSSFDYEVWNQPAHSYKYTYFNPKTKKRARTIRQAKVQLSDFPEDLFKKYRSPRARSLIGIGMKFVYIAETIPTQYTKDSPKRDRKVLVNYLYDLELDARGNILGGEWYHQHHPDFLWAPDTGASAESVGDLYLTRIKDNSEWKNREIQSIPSSWQKAAQAGASHAQPLKKIVKELIHKSNQSVLHILGHEFHLNYRKSQF